MRKRRRAPFMSIRTPEPGSVVIAACDEDGAAYWLPVPVEVFAAADWGTVWPKLAADARARLLEKTGSPAA